MPGPDNIRIIIVILGGLGVIGSIVYAMIRNRRRAEEFQDHAAEFETEARARGWTVESGGKRGEHHLFKGRGEGIAWTMEVHRHTESRESRGALGVSLVTM